MRRADRLFDIIQALRGQKRPLTAAALAEQLEVTARTIYRDMATLQARRVPIEGEPGVGYVLRKGFDLPPLMFTSEEVEAIAVGVRMVCRVRDPKLQQAADGVLRKLQHAVPSELRAQLAFPRFWVSEGSAAKPDGVALADIRKAIRDCLKVRIAYVDEQGQRTMRIIWPIATVYYVDVTLVAAWCELREAYRHFRIDRVRRSLVLDDRFATDSSRMMTEWLVIQNAETVRPGSPLS